MNSRLESLIDLFLNKVAEAEDLMKINFGIDEPRLFNQSNLDRTGNFGQYKYSFHGIGCRFKLKDVVVDYDYGDAGRTDGFDLWRLTIFGEQIESYKDYIESEKLKLDFELSITSEELKKSGAKYDNLYYLSKNI